MNASATQIASARSLKAAATRDSLLQIARTLFEQRGYFEIGTPELAAAAGLTRGALYHHFAGKLELFAAVFRMVERELFEEALGLFDPSWVSPVMRLRDGTKVYLRAVAASAGRQRIMLIDGPAALGWARWREMEAASFRDLHERNIRSLMEAGDMRPGEPRHVSRLLIAALNEAALAIAHAGPDERESVRQKVTDSLMLLIDGLLIAPVSTD